VWVNYRRFGGTCRLHPQGRRNTASNRFTLFLARAIFSTLKVEATCSSETSVYNKPIIINRRFGGICRLRPQGTRNTASNRFTLFLARAIFSTLKMEATYSSETSVYNKPTTRRHIPKDGNLRFSLLLLAGSVADLATRELLRSV
jgi:hypothetical protein